MTVATTLDQQKVDPRFWRRVLMSAVAALAIGVVCSTAADRRVVVYLQARIVGRGRITRAECLAYYDDQEDMCEDYK